MRNYFGTDGIRGKANTKPLTVDFVLRLGQAAAKLFKNEDRKHSIVIGKDTRISGYIYENAMVAGICSMGVNAILVGVLPTPAIAYLTKSLRADAGVVISASHNPYYDNGIKFFSAEGFKLSDDLEENIESYLMNSLETNPNVLGKAFRIETAIWRYVEYTKTTFDKDISLKGLKIVVDCAHGATYKVAPLALSELGAEVVVINNKPDGYNINLNCGSLHPEIVSKKVIEEKADLGITFDGDGDRVIFVDENGEIIDGDVIMGICALYMKKNNLLTRQAIVTTVLSNVGLSICMKKNDIEVYNCPVGDRYVVELMLKEKINLGGEQSGHIVFLDYNSTGDGLISALQLLKIIVKMDKPLSEIKKCIQLLPQVQRNLKVQSKVSLDKLCKTNEVLRAIESDLKGEGRVLLRYSGTESALRIMLEGCNKDKINELALQLEDVARQELEQLQRSNIW
jgi:phosphoglucosamine mutase